ncbi:MAG: hypothetical protein NVSMB17_05470 [Candidatus Dormibacteria bacterium]
MVEFAIIGPTFFLMLMMTVEAALFINAQVSVDNATREGARIAALCGSSTAAGVIYNGTNYVGKPPCVPAIEGTVRQHLGFLKINPNPINPAIVECSPVAVTGNCPAGSYSGATLGAVVEVDVTYKYSFFVPAFVLGPASPKITITATARSVSQQ